jgi:hypothetical protein
MGFRERITSSAAEDLMATSQSVTFQAAPGQVWPAVVKIINGAGYAVSETNAAAMQIKYKASGGGWAWGQLVTVSVAGVGDNETMVSVTAEAEGQATLTEGGQQRKLVRFIIDNLAKALPMAANQPTAVGAPGTSGCFGMLLFLIECSLCTCVAVSALLAR